MTPEELLKIRKKVNLLSILSPILTFIIPILVLVASYVEPITKQGLAVPFFVLIISAITVISAIRSVKKNIKMRKDMGRSVNKFMVIFAYKFPAVAIYIATVWFFAVIKDISNSLYIVLGVNAIPIIAGFVLLLVKEKLEAKLPA